MWKGGKLLLIQEKNPATTWDGINLVNNGRNYQSQLVSLPDVFHQQYETGCEWLNLGRLSSIRFFELFQKSPKCMYTYQSHGSVMGVKWWRIHPWETKILCTLKAASPQKRKELNKLNEAWLRDKVSHIIHVWYIYLHLVVFNGKIW